MHVAILHDDPLAATGACIASASIALSLNTQQPSPW
jgi:hypothetical protein